MALLAYCEQKQHSFESCNTIRTVLSDTEKAALNYLGGYVLYNLHKKHARSNSVESKQAMVILKAEKLESMTNSEKKLVSALTRGGLWSITQPVQQIFFKAECYFRDLASKSDFQRLDIASITCKAISDGDILGIYKLIISNVEFEPDSHVGKDVLYSIVRLYVTVDSFSFTRDVIQRYKIKAKQTQTKSLHKEIIGIF